jgi:hypothetical protein
MKSWRWDFVESMDSVDWNEQDGGVAELFGVVDAVDFVGVVIVSYSNIQTNLPVLFYDGILGVLLPCIICIKKPLLSPTLGPD